jgi:hypothetical protein
MEIEVMEHMTNEALLIRCCKAAAVQGAAPSKRPDGGAETTRRLAHQLSLESALTQAGRVCRRSQLLSIGSAQAASSRVFVTLNARVFLLSLLFVCLCARHA